MFRSLKRLPKYLWGNRLNQNNIQIKIMLKSAKEMPRIAIDRQNAHESCRMWLQNRKFIRRPRQQNEVSTN